MTARALSGHLLRMSTMFFKHISISAELVFAARAAHDHGEKKIEYSEEEEHDGVTGEVDAFKSQVVVIQREEFGDVQSRGVDVVQTRHGSGDKGQGQRGHTANGRIERLFAAQIVDQIARSHGHEAEQGKAKQEMGESRAIFDMRKKDKASTAEKQKKKEREQREAEYDLAVVAPGSET